MPFTRRQILAGAAALALGGCQVAPGTGRSGFNLLSEDDERALGSQTHPQILKEFGGAYDDPMLAAYIAGLGQRLVQVSETPAAEFRFTVLNSHIVNAMALPGGYVYITRGLLAAVLGAAAYLQSFSRDQESEADHLGLRYRVRGAGIPALATHPSGAAIVFDGVPARGIGDMGQYISRVWLSWSQVSGLEAIEVGGMPAATAATTGRTKHGQADVRVVAIRFGAEAIYCFTFVTPPEQTASLSAELRRATYSFRRLIAEERAGIQPWRIKVVTVRPGDTVDGLAARMAPGQWQTELFRVINGLPPGEEPEPGRRVKLVMA